MKKWIVMLLAVLLLCTGCTKSLNDVEEKPTGTESKPTESEGMPNEYQPSHDLTDPMTTFDSVYVTCIGKTVGELIEDFGEPNETVLYNGKPLLRYEQPHIGALADSEDSFAETDDKITAVLLYDEQLADGLPVCCTYMQLEAVLEDLAEPTLNDETEEYTVSFEVAGYKYTVFWSADPMTAPADYVLVEFAK